MDERIRQDIKDKADWIRSIIRGDTMLGLPLDESDVDMLIVAAYYAGMNVAEGILVFDHPASEDKIAGMCERWKADLRCIDGAWKDVVVLSDLPDMSDKWVRMKLEAESGSGEE